MCLLENYELAMCRCRIAKDELLGGEGDLKVSCPRSYYP